MRQGNTSFKFFLMNSWHVNQVHGGAYQSQLKDFFVSSGPFTQRRRGLPEAACKVSIAVVP